MHYQRLVQDLESHFGGGAPPVRISRAPYRVSPLGAHTDHQNGLVLGFTLEPAIRLAFRPRDDGRVRAASRGYVQSVDFELESIGPRDGTFGDYLRGVAVASKDAGPVARGLDAFIEGDLKPGGISSSAALQVAFALALLDVNGIVLERERIMRLVVAAERQYAGVNVGLLDPAVILFGDAGKLVSLDCAEGVPRAQRMPASLDPFDVLLFDSGVVRDLRTAPYNQRVAECREAARLLGAKGDPPMLREISLETLRRRRSTLDPVLAQRAEHVLMENKRVRNGLAALQQGDLFAFGRLMNASGNSMVHLFGAGTPETSLLLEVLQRDPDVIGATLSGAGFGGSLLAFSRPGRAAEVRARAVEKAAVRLGDAAERVSVRAVRTGPGAAIVDAAA